MSSWAELTPNEKRVLESALERDSLPGVYRRWRPWDVKRINGGANNRDGPYVEVLIQAAERLLGLGLVGIMQVNPRVDDLAEPDALRAIQDVNNWWRYRPEYAIHDAGDPGLPADGVLPGGHEADDYYVIAKDLKDFRMDSWAPSERLAYLTGA